MNVATILKHKGAEIVSVGADATLQDAVALLAGKRIGATLVLDGKGQIQVDDQKSRTFRDKKPRNTFAEATGRAGDDRDLAV